MPVLVNAVLSVGWRTLALRVIESVRNICWAKPNLNFSKSRKPAPLTANPHQLKSNRPPLRSLQSWTASPQKTRYPIRPSSLHLSPSVLKLPTSSTPSLLQYWVILLPKAIQPLIHIRLPLRRPPSIPSLLLHQSTSPPGPVPLATHYCLLSRTATSLHLWSHQAQDLLPRPTFLARLLHRSTPTVVPRHHLLIFRRTRSQHPSFKRVP